MFAPARGRSYPKLCSEPEKTTAPVNQLTDAAETGPLRTGRGTCLEEAMVGSSGGRRRYDAASPEPMYRSLQSCPKARPSGPGESDYRTVLRDSQGPISKFGRATRPRCGDEALTSSGTRGRQSRTVQDIRFTCLD